MKKVITLLVLLVCVALLCMPAFAAEESTAYPVEGGNIYFDKATGIITGCDQSVTSAVVPSEIDGVAVVAVGESAFSMRYELVSVELPEGLKSIGDSGFAACSKLKSVKLPDSLESIGVEAFYSCDRMRSISIPANVKHIGAYAFSRCLMIQEFSFPEGIETVSEGVLEMCTFLKRVYIPDSVTTICSDAFECCYLEELTLPKNLKTIGIRAFDSCMVFSKLIIPEGVTEIGDYAFSNCVGIETLTLPKSLISIGDSAFGNCHGIKKVNYFGSEEDWKSIEIMGNNDYMLSAEINYLGEADKYTFLDVFPENWYHDAIIAAAESGIIAGNPDGTFAPKSELTWAQTIVFAARLDQYRKGLEVYGPEDQTGVWYSIYVDYCLANSIIDSAYPEIMGKPITRAGAAVIFAKVLGDAEKINTVPDGYFSDVGEEDAAHDAVYALAEAGICNGMGKGLFGLNESFPRSQVATIVARMAGLVEPVIIE